MKRIGNMFLILLFCGCYLFLQSAFSHILILDHHESAHIHTDDSHTHTEYREDVCHTNDCLKHCSSIESLKNEVVLQKSIYIGEELPLHLLPYYNTLACERAYIAIEDTVLDTTIPRHILLDRIGPTVRIL